MKTLSLLLEDFEQQLRPCKGTCHSIVGGAKWIRPNLKKDSKGFFTLFPEGDRPVSVRI